MRLATITMALSMLAVCAHAPAGRADPLHKVGAEGAWQHEGSGWIFSKRIGSSDRVDVPYTIDGNDDVGVQYEIPIDGISASATVEVYRADSAASGAQLQDAAVRTPFAGDVSSAPAGIKATLTAGDGSRVSLYRFETSDWIVVIRAIIPMGKNTAPELDSFVRALPWESLGTDTSALHQPSS